MYILDDLVTIESTGIFSAEEIFLRALKVLEEKAKSYIIWSTVIFIANYRDESFKADTIRIILVLLWVKP